MLFFISCNNEKQSKDKVKTKKEQESQEKKQSKKNEEVQIKKATATLEETNGSGLSGQVKFTEKDGSVTMEASISGLSEGKHAIHIHEKGDCSAADGKSAGGHWNPTNSNHGRFGSPKGYHKGDIGNFITKPDGIGFISLTTSEWCINCNDSNKNIVGKSIIVHDGEDDFTSQPSGDAGNRVGCGVINMK